MNFLKLIFMKTNEKKLACLFEARPIWVRKLFSGLVIIVMMLSLTATSSGHITRKERNAIKAKVKEYEQFIGSTITTSTPFTPFEEVARMRAEAGQGANYITMRVKGGKNDDVVANQAAGTAAAMHEFAKKTFAIMMGGGGASTAKGIPGEKGSTFDHLEDFQFFYEAEIRKFQMNSVTFFATNGKSTSIVVLAYFTPSQVVEAVNNAIKKVEETNGKKSELQKGRWQRLKEGAKAIVGIDL